MKREKALERQIKVKADLDKITDLIQNLPDNQYIHFDYKVWFYTTGIYEPVSVIGILKEFLQESVTIKIMAVSKKCYPFDRPFVADKGLVSLKFKKIVGWKTLDKKDLPLILGYELKFPLLERIFKYEV